MNRIKKILSLVLICVMIFGILPVSAKEAAQETAAVPIVVDFKQTVKEAADEPWWDSFADIPLENGGTSKRVGSYVNQSMTAAEKEAYAAMRDWLSETQNWNIVEDDTKLISYNGNRLYFCADDSANWGISYNPYYRNTQLALEVDVEAEGWYHLDLDVMLLDGSSTDWPVENTYGFTYTGWADILVNGQTLYKEFSFKGNTRAVRSLGAVYLEEGTNTVHIKSVKSYDGSTTATPFSHMNLCSMTFSPIEGQTVVETGSKTVDLSESWLPFDKALTRDHVIESDDETIVTAYVNDTGKLVLEGRRVGSTQLTITLDGDVICVMDVQVTARTLESLQPIVIDFKAFARKARLQSWWDSLFAGTTMDGGETRRIGNTYNQKMTDEEHEAYKQMLSWLSENETWNISVGGWDSNNRYSGNRGWLCPDKNVEWGFMFNAYFIDYGETSNLNLTVDVPEAGWYSLGLDASLQGTGAQDYPNETGAAAGGAYIDVLVNGELVRDNECLTGTGMRHCNVGKVYLNPGENTITIASVGNVFGATTSNGGAYSSRANIGLKQLALTPLGLHILPEGSEVRMDLRQMYLPYDQDMNKAKIKAADPEVAEIAFDETGAMVVKALQPGSTNVSVTKYGAALCEFTLKVEEASARLDGSALTVSQDGWYRVQVQYDCDVEQGTTRFFLDDTLLGTVSTDAAEHSIQTKNLPAVYLTAGQYELTSDTKLPYTMFVTACDEPVITLYAKDRLSMKKGRTDVTSFAACWDDGMEEELLAAKWNVEVSDESILKAELQQATERLLPTLAVTGLEPSDDAWVKVTAEVNGAEDQVIIPVTVDEPAVAASMDVSLKGIKDGQVARNSLQHFDFVMADADGESVYAQEVQIDYVCEPEGIVRIDEENHTLQALANGDVTVTVTVQSGSNIMEKTLELTVADTGANLLDEESSSFEGGTGGSWTGLNGFGDPNATGWSQVMDDGTGNMAIKLQKNPDVAYSGFTGVYLNLAYGKYVKVEPGHMYELSFRVKIDEYENAPEAASFLRFIAQGYDYMTAYGGTSINQMQVTKNVPTDKLGQWFTFTLPVRAPIEADGSYYIMPVISVQPNFPLEQALTGWKLTAWIDDYQIREVGLGEISMHLEEPLTKVDQVTNLVIEPKTTTGTIIRLDDATGVEVTAGNSDVIDICGELTMAAGPSGDTVPMIPVTMVGLNAPCEMETAVTVHGVTCTGTLDVTTSGMQEVLRDMTYTLDGFGAITLTCGSVAVGDVTARTTQLKILSEEDLRSGGSVFFRSSDPSVVTVDQETGDVTAVGEGKAVLTVYGNMDGMTRSDTMEVVVTDDTDLESVSVRANVDYVGVGSSLQLYTDGKKASGVKADMNLYPVAYTMDEEAEAYAVLTRDGRLTGVKAGTVTVTATAAVNGKAVSDTIEIQVVDDSRLAGEDILIDFTNGKALRLETATLEKNGYEVNRELTYAGGSKLAYNIKGGLWVQNMVTGDRFVLDFVVSKSGWYAPWMQSSLLNYGGNAKMFVDNTYIGFMDFNQGKSEWYAGKQDFNCVYLEAGVHSLIFEAAKNGFIFPGILRFNAISTPHEMDVSLSVKQELLVGEVVTADMVIETANDTGFVLDALDTDAAYDNYYRLVSDAPDVVSVSGNTLTALKKGLAVITAYAQVDGQTVERQISLTVSEGVVHSVQLQAERTTLKPDAQGTQLTVTGYDMTGSALDALPEGVKVSYESSDAALAAVSEDGFVTITGKEGSVLVTVTVTENGRSVTASEWIVITVGKTEPTIYTNEERAIARENVLKYDWAWNEKEAAVTQADFVVENLDAFYDLIIHEGIPRHATVGLYNDPDIYTCRYCGVYLAEKHTVYPWIVDPINNPWKITCPECHRDFPSNDFGAYYESGLDETGRFQYELADESLLVNELYPEMGEGWGVDNGQGYVTGDVYSNGVKEVHTYIAYYMHCVYYPLGETKYSLNRAMSALRDAYIYTGDEAYGNAGAILLDRFADIYPEADYYLYEKRLLGKIIQAIWESSSLAQMLATCSDAFWPCMENEEVIAYLQANAWRKPIDPQLITPDYLRERVETNILLEIKEGCETTDIYGNFGFHQACMAYAAVALDRMPYTEEMLDWVFRYGERSGSASDLTLDGGSLLYDLVGRFDRDGFGGDGSAAYNQLWYRNLDKVADALENYDKVEGANLWENPRFYNQFHSFVKLTRMGTTAVMSGEAGLIQSYGTYTEVSYLVRAFTKTGDREIARVLYHENGNSVAGLHADIFTKDPEFGLRSAVQQIVEEDGVWNMSQSEMMSGNGLAIMRSGPETILKGVNENKFSDYWMFFGLNGGTHGAIEALHIGIGAYGLDLTSGLGYPNVVNTEDPERQQWMRNNSSHNTVMVDDWAQSEYGTGIAEPLHFEDAGFVKVMDAQAPRAYEQTDIYRRSMIMVQANEGVSYAVDFFRILGGHDHVYSFHANTMLHPETEGLDFVHQTMGTYAGADVPLGHHKVNPYSNDATVNTGSGYSWLDDVYRDEAPETIFSVDFEVEDFNNVLVDSQDIHLKLTMLSEEPVTEAAIASGHPSQKPGNPEYMKYLLVRRSGEVGLDTLFTSVIEPYKYESYIEKAELLQLQMVEGEPNVHGRAAAVKVTLKDGREDFIVYSTNERCTYAVYDTDGTEKFRCAGFACVYSYRDDALIYAYGNDASYLSDVDEDALPALTGTVLDFSKGLAHRSFLTVRFDQPVTEELLKDRYIYIDNHTEQNGTYRIHNAETEGDTVVLDLNKQSFVLRYADGRDLDKGYIYNVAEGQSFRVPLGTSFDTMALFTHAKDTVVRTGTKLTLQTGVEGADCTYKAEGLVSGMKFNAATGELVWMPAKAQAGKYPITVSALCDGKVLAEMSFVIYAVSYSGSTYAADICTHAKAVTYDDMIVCPACGSITRKSDEVEKFNIAGSNMTLGNELKLNILVENEKLADGDYTVKITHNGQTAEKVLERYNGTYSYVSCSVSAKQMSDVITAEVYKDGVAVSEIYETSVRTYAMNILNNGKLGVDVKTLVVDMLNYGAQAQKYFAYNAADPANARLNAAQKALATGSVPCENEQVKGRNFYGSNLSLEDRIVLNMFFQNCSDGMTAAISYTSYDGTAVSVDAVPVLYSGNIYKVVVDEIVLADAFSPVTVTVYKDGEIVGSATDSVESYVARTGNSAINEAIMKFAYSAREYLG